METSLHRELKLLFGGEAAQLEVTLDGYRIDAVCDGRLVEIQHGSLAAIRDKVQTLLREHKLTVVKPIVVRKLLVKLSARGGEIVGRRMSPKRGGVLDLFDDLVHFTRVFPHRRLTLEVPMVEIEEWRYPGHGRRRRWRENDFEVEDQRLVCIQRTYRLRTPSDLKQLITWPDARPFHTGHLAERLGVQRWTARRIAYCCRRCGVIRRVGKRGNALLYDFVKRRRRKSAA